MKIAGMRAKAAFASFTLIVLLLTARSAFAADSHALDAPFSTATRAAIEAALDKSYRETNASRSP